MSAIRSFAQCLIVCPVVSATFPAGKVLSSIPAPWCKTFAQNVGNEEHPQNVLHFFSLKNWRTLKTGLHGFLQNCARWKKGWSESAATSAPVQHEVVQAVLGMKPKHIQVGHFCFPLPLPRVFSALFSAPKFSPPTYLPPPLLNLNSFSLPWV